jgi:predicted ATPase
MEVAAHLTDGFPDGVWFFELAAVTDPASVPDAVASVLGITQQPGKSVSESVAAALEGRTRLLVFDNCEHVLDAATDLVEAILGQSATVRILATSREGLRVADGQLWPVPSLDVGAGIYSAAVSLFVERAQAVSPRFSISNADEAGAVVEICRSLDGIPLAIELAASRMASMTAIEVRDRLDHRFRLLVGSRRGLERHHTLRYAVQWSYDLLQDAEKVLLDRCSVFAGGFDLQSACAVSGFDDSDDYFVLDLLDALVRKSLLVADRSAERTRFSMLETIRQFAEEQLVASGEGEKARAAHARYFAGREADIMDLWDSPQQREAYTWFTAELANLRTAFRWAADQGDLDVAVGIATYAAILGYMTENYEPTTWVEEVVQSARAVDHPRLAFLYAMASVCWMTGRVEAAVAYTSACESVLNSGHCELPFGVDGLIGSVYLAIGQPERYVELSRGQLARGRGANPMARASLVLALAVAGTHDEARSAAAGLVDAAEAFRNPSALSLALLACGYVFRDADPVRALADLRRGLLIAQANGQRTYVTHLATSLARLEANSGDPLAALDYLTLAIRNYHDSGNIIQAHGSLRILAACLHRVERYESAATIAGFARSDLSETVMPEVNAAIVHVRQILGDASYESLARKGKGMTTAAALEYAYDQIHQARVALNAVSE